MFQGLGRAPLVRAFYTVATSTTAAGQGHTRRPVCVYSKSCAIRQLTARAAPRRQAAVAYMSSEGTPAVEKIEAPASMMDDEVDPGEIEGTDLRVLKYPHPALRAENEEIEEFSDDVKKMAREMFKVMYAMNGVGLAAPQVGINKRLMVFNPEGEEKSWLDEAILVNPKIVAFGKGKVTEEEGCLSFPGMRGQVERANWVKVEAVNAKGKKIKKKYTDWTARIFMHEYDHLDGVVYIDRLSENERKKVQPTLDKLVESFGEGGAL